MFSRHVGRIVSQFLVVNNLVSLDEIKWSFDDIKDLHDIFDQSTNLLGKWAVCSAAVQGDDKIITQILDNIKLDKDARLQILRYALGKADLKMCRFLLGMKIFNPLDRTVLTAAFSRPDGDQGRILKMVMNHPRISSKKGRKHLADRANLEYYLRMGVFSGDPDTCKFMIGCPILTANQKIVMDVARSMMSRQLCRAIMENKIFCDRLDNEYYNVIDMLRWLGCF